MEAIRKGTREIVQVGAERIGIVTSAQGHGHCVHGLFLCAPARLNRQCQDGLASETVAEGGCRICDPFHKKPFPGELFAKQQAGGVFPWQMASDALVRVSRSAG
jgi:hypothetical protein